MGVGGEGTPEGEEEGRRGKRRRTRGNRMVKMGEGQRLRTKRYDD